MVHSRLFVKGQREGTTSTETGNCKTTKSFNGAKATFASHEHFLQAKTFEFDQKNNQRGM